MKYRQRLRDREETNIKRHLGVCAVVERSGEPVSVGPDRALVEDAVGVEHDARGAGEAVLVDDALENGVEGLLPVRSNDGRRQQTQEKNKLLHCGLER